MAAVQTLPKEVSKIGSSEVKLFGKWDTAEYVPKVLSVKQAMLTAMLL